ncbi:MAG: peptide-methionine (S)-S-oxide reductase MsrA [Atopostipes sp.]|nr:peptide-methionine (S)-S-oxide reductase MsrA [Atopostipes sp.]
MEKALFAGGCFWCMVEPFDSRPGIERVVSGYSGGHTENPTYEEVKSQQTGHKEVVQITFDPEIISYQELLTIYWQVSDPTDDGGQFMDRGDSYRPVIYYYTDEQRIMAEESKADLIASGKYHKPIVVPIKKAQRFYLAEEKHQDFHLKNKEDYQKEKEERAQWQMSQK